MRSGTTSSWARSLAVCLAWAAVALTSAPSSALVLAHPQPSAVQATGPETRIGGLSTRAAARYRLLEPASQRLHCGICDLGGRTRVGGFNLGQCESSQLHRPGQGWPPASRASPRRRVRSGLERRGELRGPSPTPRWGCSRNSRSSTRRIFSDRLLNLMMFGTNQIGELWGRARSEVMSVAGRNVPETAVQPADIEISALVNMLGMGSGARGIIEGGSAQDFLSRRALGNEEAWNRGLFGVAQRRAWPGGCCLAERCQGLGPGPESRCSRRSKGC